MASANRCRLRSVIVLAVVNVVRVVVIAMMRHDVGRILVNDIVMIVANYVAV